MFAAPLGSLVCSRPSPKELEQCYCVRAFVGRISNYTFKASNQRQQRCWAKCRKKKNALGPECSHLADPYHPYLDQKIVFTMPTTGGQLRCQASLNFVGTRMIKMYMVIVLLHPQMEF